MLSSIQFLRFAAALMVTVFHAVVATNAAGADFPGWVLRAAWTGSAGVPIFFAISGLVMYVSSQPNFGKPGASTDFVIRRALRIYPIYWICICFYLLFPPSTEAGSDQWNWQALFLLPGHAAEIIPPGWTLAYELYFYLVFAVLLLRPARQAPLLLALFFLISVVAGIGLPVKGPFLQVATNIQLFIFLSGVILGRLLFDAQDRVQRLVTNVPVWLIAGIAVAGFALAPSLEADGIPSTLSLGIPSMLVVFCAALADARRRVPAAVKCCAWLGDSSYALYLAHMFVIWRGIEFLDLEHSHWAIAGLAVLALVLTAIATGMALHYGIERPLMRRVRARMRRSQTQG